MRPEKTSLVAEIGERIRDAEFAMLVDYRGLTVDKLTELRQQLRQQKSKLMVVPNRFLGIAAGAQGVQGLAPCLEGPTALVTGRGDVTEVAKVLAAYAKGNPLLKIKGGVIGRTAIPAADVESLAKLPARPVMLGMAVGTIAAPMMGLVGVLNQKVCSLLYVLQAIEKKKGGAQQQAA
jgi:large subunit ribosomal protein L10